MIKNKKDNTVGIKIFLICFVICVVIVCLVVLKLDNNIKDDGEEKCKLDCSSFGYIYNNGICTCIDNKEELNNSCKLYCKSDKFYMNNDSQCVCDNGEKVYYNGKLIYSNDIVYEYEDNFNNWLSDVRGNEVFVTVVANSYCGHCVKYQPIVHNLWDKYKFKLHVLHTDKLSESENDELFSLDFPNYNGTPYTFVMLNGEVIDYLNGTVTKDTLNDFLINNNLIK